MEKWRRGPGICKSVEEIRDQLLSSRQVDDRGCWNWPFAKDKEKGYGKMMASLNGQSKIRYVHRVSAMMFLGFDIESRICVLHRCDNPACYNPNHFFYGDRVDNNRDMYKKGRQVNPPVMLGAKNPEAFLNEDQVLIIRMGLQYGERGVDLARRFGVTEGCIAAIKHRRIWAHL